ncbi:MAG: hypothetical protein ACI8TX_002743 [Hyphomicrobiaceae bacterium]|jgi:hypothetical protein
MSHILSSAAVAAFLLTVACPVAADQFSATAGTTITSSDPRGIAGDNRCVVWFRLTSAVDVSNLNFTVDYRLADGTFIGEGSRVECGVAITGRTVAAYRDRDIDGVREFNAAIIRLNNFSGPTDLAACRWLFNDAPPSIGDFSAVVTGAGTHDPDSGDIDDIRPLPKVRVDRVVCPGELPNGLSTTTTTTTTLTSVTSSTLLLGEICGVPVSGGESPKASDALFALQAAVGVRSCELCLCDANGSGALGASDALAILRAAVGGDGDLDCPTCTF